MDNTYLIVQTKTGVIYAGKQCVSDNADIVLSNACRIFLDSHYILSDIILGRPVKASISNVVSSISVFEVAKSFPISEIRFRSIHTLPYCGPSKNYRSNYNYLCLSSYRGYPVINVDSLPVAIQFTHGRFSKGSCVLESLFSEDGYTITYLDYSTFDVTLHKAFDKIQNEILNYQEDKTDLNSTVDFIVTTYPNVDSLIPCLELVLLHNKLTHSCRSGIRDFCATHNIDLRKEYSMRYFLTVVKDAYSPELISNVVERYGITI